MQILTKDRVIVVSKAEVEIVRLLADGLKIPDIAKSRVRALKTVEAQVYGLRKKTGCKSAAHLVATFIRNKIIE